MRLREYAAREGIHYLTAWRRVKKGHTAVRKTGDGTYQVIPLKAKSPRRGAPQRWSREKVVKEIYIYCKPNYITTKKIPSYLYKLAVKFCGSVRQAKWEAGIIRDLRSNKKVSLNRLKKSETHKKFLIWIQSYCKSRYRKSSLWPAYMRQLAIRYYGSVRAAKHSAGILKDQRKLK